MFPVEVIAPESIVPSKVAEPSPPIVKFVFPPSLNFIGIASGAFIFIAPPTILI